MNKKEKTVKTVDAEKQPSSTASKISLVIGIILCVILVPILIVNCILIVRNFTNPDRPPSLGGFTPLIVLTDSMEPLVNEGDIIIAQAVDPDTVNVGDVISFYDPASPGKAVLTHRVVEIYEEDGKRYAVTAGDNNVSSDYERDRKNDPEVENQVTIIDDHKKPGYSYVYYKGHNDTKPVELNDENLIGAYIYTRVPLVGKVSMFMQTTWGWIICIVVPLAAFFAYELIRRMKKDKSKDKDMDALLAELEALKAAKAAAEGVDQPENAPDMSETEIADAIKTDAPEEANDAPTED